MLQLHLNVCAKSLLLSCVFLISRVAAATCINFRHCNHPTRQSSTPSNELCRTHCEGLPSQHAASQSTKYWNLFRRSADTEACHSGRAVRASSSGARTCAHTQLLVRLPARCSRLEQRAVVSRRNLGELRCVPPRQQSLAGAAHCGPPRRSQRIQPRGRPLNLRQL